MTKRKTALHHVFLGQFAASPQATHTRANSVAEPNELSIFHARRTLGSRARINHGSKCRRLTTPCPPRKNSTAVEGKRPLSSAYDAFMAHARTLTNKYSDLRLSEADTRSYLIDPVLRLLGYESVENLRREVSVPATKEFIDYELRVGGAPHVLIEAKAIRHELTDQHSAQCVQYAAVLGVRWCLITNGVEWLLYDATAKGPLAKKRVADVKLDTSEASCLHAWNVLSLFAREELERSRPINTLLIGRVVLDELDDAESSIVESLRRAIQTRFGERVTNADVVATIRKLIRPNDLVPLPTPPAPILEPSPKSGPFSPTPGATAPEPSKRRVTLRDLVTAGLLPEGASIEANVKGVTHVARIVAGQIQLEGATYDSPSAASIAMR